jgi:1,4-dihydroxy-2-naphthoate octaprenyltransferase
VSPAATVLQATRPAFLVLGPVCVWLGLATALHTQAAVSVPLCVLILLGAVAAHVSVNALNEYHDFKSGLDLATEKTAFSGGSGALPANPEMAGAVLVTGLVALAVTAAVGVYLVTVRAPQLLPLGAAGLVLVVTYTQWLNREPFLCLLAPGLGFGVLMVVGTHVALTGSYPPLVWLLSLVPFFLTNNLLLLNQYPDINADAAVGRRHLPIVFGIGVSNTVYALFAAAAYLTIVLLVLTRQVPALASLALLPALLSLYALGGMLRHGARIAAAPQYMAANVAASVLTPLLLGIGLVFG